MLSSEFSQEMGALIRSLEQKVRMEPGLFTQPSEPAATMFARDHIERAIIALVAIYLSLSPK